MIWSEVRFPREWRDATTMGSIRGSERSILKRRQQPPVEKVRKATVFASCSCAGGELSVPHHHNPLSPSSFLLPWRFEGRAPPPPLCLVCRLLPDLLATSTLQGSHLPILSCCSTQVSRSFLIMPNAAWIRWVEARDTGGGGGAVSSGGSGCVCEQTDAPV